MPARTFTSADRFEFLIDYLCELVAAVGARHKLTVSVIELIRTRIWRLGVRFARLAEQIRTGTLAAMAPVRSRSALRPPEGSSRAPSVLPQQRGWLLRWIPEVELSAVNQMEWMLALPDMKELIAATPQMGRILRPLCVMLGVSLPAALRLPRRARVRSAEVVASEPAPAPEPAPAQRAEESAWPQWREPGPPRETEDEFGKFRPPKNPG